MTDFVIEYYSHEGYADLQTLKLMNNYANLLKKELTLGMFVPVDSSGEILKEPRNYESWKALEHNSKKGMMKKVRLSKIIKSIRKPKKMSF